MKCLHLDPYWARFVGRLGNGFLYSCRLHCKSAHLTRHLSHPFGCERLRTTPGPGLTPVRCPSCVRRSGFPRCVQGSSVPRLCLRSLTEHLTHSRCSVLNCQMSGRTSHIPDVYLTVLAISNWQRWHCPLWQPKRRKAEVKPQFCVTHALTSRPISILSFLFDKRTS